MSKERWSMQYYDNSALLAIPHLLDYFNKGIGKNISHCLLFWGADINLQCNLALEIARLLNCTQDKSFECDCLNCRWIRQQTHPAVKIYTRLDFKENSNSKDEDETSKGKKNITIEQAKSIVNELSVTSDYHRVYIFCDRDEDGRLLPLNRINFPEATSNALLKTFEEPPKNTTFIFLTNDTDQIISTIVSRSQTFFVPSVNSENPSYQDVENIIQNYWTTDRNDVLKFENELFALANEHEPTDILTQIQNYMVETMKANLHNKRLFYRLLKDLKNVEEAKRQLSLTPAMNLQTVIANLCFNMIL